MDFSGLRSTGLGGQLGGAGLLFCGIGGGEEVVVGDAGEAVWEELLLLSKNS